MANSLQLPCLLGLNQLVGSQLKEFGHAFVVPMGVVHTDGPEVDGQLGLTGGHWWRQSSGAGGRLVLERIDEILPRETLKEPEREKETCDRWSLAIPLRGSEGSMAETTEAEVV